jgi:hypothetical protein
MILKKYVTFQFLFRSTKITLTINICAFTLCQATQETELHGSQTGKKK